MAENYTFLFNNRCRLFFQNAVIQRQIVSGNGRNYPKFSLDESRAKKPQSNKKLFKLE